jgi:hypothetical protein
VILKMITNEQTKQPTNQKLSVINLYIYMTFFFLNSTKFILNGSDDGVLHLKGRGHRYCT